MAVIAWHARIAARSVQADVAAAAQRLSATQPRMQEGVARQADIPGTDMKEARRVQAAVTVRVIGVNRWHERLSKHRAGPPRPATFGRIPLAIPQPPP